MLKNFTIKIQLSGYKWLFQLAFIVCFLGTFQRAKSQDMGVTSLIAPLSPICAANNQTVVVRIKNYAVDTMKYNVNSVVITVKVTGASTQTFKDTLNTGFLAPDSAQNVTVTIHCNLSASGSHVFKAYTSLTGDLSALNDTLAPVGIVVNPLPVAVITTYDTTTFCQGDSAVLVSSSATGNVWSNGSTNDSITVSISGEFAVTVTSGGCSSTSDTTTIIVNAIPATPTITASDTTIFCLGEHVILFSSSSSGNIWTGGSTADSLIVTASGTYSVTLSIHGCSSISAGTTITVKPLPTVTLAPFLLSPCSSTPAFNLIGGLPTGGTYSGIGVTAGMFYPGSAGAVQGITYTYTDLNGCTNSASRNMIVQFCSGIEEFSSQEMLVYPNPSSNGLFNIAIKNANFNELLISILDIQGKEVFNMLDKNLSSDYNKQINIKDLAKGIYYMKLSTDDTVKIQKLIVE